MRARILRWSLGAGAVLLLAVLLLLYTPPGLELVGRMAAALSGGQVRVEGLGGLFPGRLHARRIEIADRNGPWLRIEDAALTWSAPALLSNHVAVDGVSASRIDVLRRPLPAAEAGGETPRIDIARLSFPRINLAAPVIGQPVTLSAAGSLHYLSLHRMDADLLVTRAGRDDRYRIAGGITDDVAHGEAAIREGADGILGKLVGLPGLGPVNLSAQARGDARANALAFRLTAGPLSADGQGTIALASRRADLDVRLSAPAMVPSTGIAWRDMSGEAHVHGRFDAPQVDAHLLLADGTVEGVTMKRLNVDVTGDTGHVALHGQAEEVAVPGDRTGLIARTPVRFEAEAALADAAGTVRFALTHPLAQMRGTAQTKGPLKVAADLTLPALGPLAALAAAPLDGNAALHLALSQDGKRLLAALDGRLDARGADLPARLLGRTRLNLTATLEGSDLPAAHLALQGAALKADLSGSLRAKRLAFHYTLGLTDLSRLTGAVKGTVTLSGTARGPLDNAALAANGTAILTARTFTRQRLRIALKADGLPALRSASLALDGRLEDAPLTLRATLGGGKARHANLTARWRSLDANADIAIGAVLSGKARLALGQLSDLAALTGMPVSGAAEAAVTFAPHGGKTDAALTARLTGLRGGGIAAQAASLQGTVGDALGKPQLDLALAVQQIAAQGWRGGAEAKLQGPLDRLGITAQSTLADASATPLKAQAAASLDLTQQQVTLSALDATWRGLALGLDAPATLHFADGLAVDHLAAHLGKGRVTAAGRITPDLAVTATLRDVALADFRAFLPETGAQGTISGEADLQGSLAAPTGRVTLRGEGLRAAFTPNGVPPGTIALSLQLMGDHAAVDASLDAGANAHLTLAGTAPLKPDGAIALHTAGKADLALLDAVLAVSGRRLRGTLTLEGDIAGTLAVPRVTGRGSLANGEIQDYAQSLRVHDLAASFTADGTRLTLTRLTGQAGPGTLSASGSIDLAAPDMPIDMRFEARNARPIASDLMTMGLTGTAALTGHVKTSMTLGGDIQITGGEINLPDSFPPEVAILNVRRRGQPPPPPPAAPSRILLDLKVRTTGPVFVRGHGMDAEMGGTIQVGGSVTAPALSGGLEMTRGTYTLAGQTLNFTSGRVRFDGTGVRGRLDPSLDFVAQTVSGGVTATLTITGYASQPKIALSSSPQLPQDEVVAHLLFQQSVRQLTPLQLASIAQAAAAMGGIGNGFNPLGAVRRTLGLDRLSVGSAQGGASGTESQTMVEAGRYVMRDVYVGVKQNLSGGTQTQVQVDITKRLKAQATLSTGASTATTQGNALQDTGSSVGLSYQFEY